MVNTQGHNILLAGYILQLLAIIMFCKLYSSVEKKFHQSYNKKLLLNIFFQEATRQNYFLTSEEEGKIRMHYEYVLHEMCSHFQPPMPRGVLVRMHADIIHERLLCIAHLTNFITESHNNVADENFYFKMDVINGNCGNVQISR